MIQKRGGDSIRVMLATTLNQKSKRGEMCDGGFNIVNTQCEMIQFHGSSLPHILRMQIDEIKTCGHGMSIWVSFLEL